MLEKYKHKKFNLKPNKKKLPINEINFNSIKEFNDVYFYCKKNFKEVKSTLSQGISYKKSERYHERFCVIKGNQRFELVVICLEGCFRFILKNKKAESNTVSGIKAAREIYNQADKLNIDLSKYISSDTEGKKIKEEIKRPHINVLFDKAINKELDSVYHIDFNSSYASRISEKYPELKELYNSMYKQRKDNNDYFKHVLTNSIGCFQSEYCPDYNDRRRTVRYQFAQLSKVAINDTRYLVDDYIRKLVNKGYIPLLSNTDGIWYYSPDNTCYSDSNEGIELCQWKTDHKDCKFLMTSVGCYQFIEDNKCHTVVRGLCNLDAVEQDRTKWKFGDIKKIKEIFTYKFDSEKGVIKTND